MVTSPRGASNGTTRKVGSPSGSVMSKGGSAFRWTPAVVTSATRASRTGVRRGAHGTDRDSTNPRRRAHASPSHGSRLKSCTATRFPRSPRATSELSAPTLFGGQVLQAGRPPSGANGLRELERQAFALDLARQRLRVVVHGHELDLEIGRRGEDRVPAVGGAVVLGTADDAHVDRVRRVREGTVPFHARVGAQQNVGIALAQHPRQQSA